MLFIILLESPIYFFRAINYYANNNVIKLNEYGIFIKLLSYSLLVDEKQVSKHNRQYFVEIGVCISSRTSRRNVKQNDGGKQNR